jgi:hypothetical protein
MELTLYKATELASFYLFINTETGELDVDRFNSAAIALAEKQRRLSRPSQVKP